jgi:hypothetical protein
MSGFLPYGIIELSTTTVNISALNLTDAAQAKMSVTSKNFTRAGS